MFFKGVWGRSHVLTHAAVQTQPHQELLEVGDEFLARVAFVHQVEEEEAVAVEEVLVLGGGADDASRLWREKEGRELVYNE